MWSERLLWLCFSLLGIAQMSSSAIFYFFPEIYKAGVTTGFESLIIVCGAMLSYMGLWNMAYMKGLRQYENMTGILCVLSDLDDLEGEN